MRRLIIALIAGLAATAAYAGETKVIVSDALFPEGPLMKDGVLYFVEYGGHRIRTWDGNETKLFWSQDGCGPSAIVELGANYAVTCYDRGQMAVVSPEGKTLSLHGKDDVGGVLVGPNDATPDGKGGIYFTASGPWESGPIVGRVLHMTADGKITEAANNLHYANGLTRSADGSLLYVNESEAGRVITFKIGADGSLSDRRLFTRLYQLENDIAAYPDGIKLGPDGNLYVGHYFGTDANLYPGNYHAGKIAVLNTSGKLLRMIEVPSPGSPNLTFSADGKTLYVMAVDDTSGAPYKGKVYALENK
jgi:gluconolactonase